MKRKYISPDCVMCEVEMETVFMEGSFDIHPEIPAEPWSVSGDGDGSIGWNSSIWDDEE
ncbi:MAG: hypothetical protein NC388_07380 [Clostridium sp.]|nr:hypothetical protein [Clostridium sp.]